MAPVQSTLGNAAYPRGLHPQQRHSQTTEICQCLANCFKVKFVALKELCHEIYQNSNSANCLQTE